MFDLSATATACTGSALGSPFWLTIAAPIAASIPGVASALVAVYLAHRFAQRREKNAFDHTAELVAQKNSFDKEESIRKESVQRKLDALEKTAASIHSTINELHAMRSRADEGLFPDRTSGPLVAACVVLQLHFGDIFDVQAEALARIYGECIKSIRDIALAATWLQRRKEGKSQDDGVAGERRNFDSAVESYNGNLSELEKQVSQLLLDLRTATDWTLQRNQRISGILHSP